MATNGLALPSGPHIPATSVTVQEMDALVREVRSASLYNRQLSSICQVNGLKSTGVKAELQRRITDRKSPQFQITLSSLMHRFPHTILELFCFFHPQRPTLFSVAHFLPSERHPLLIRYSSNPRDLQRSGRGGILPSPSKYS